MTMISNTHKFVYVSGGRNATGAIHAALQKIPNVKFYEPAKKNSSLWKKFDKHMPARYIKENIGVDVWDDYFKFTFVRNTYSWVVSSFFFWVKIGRQKMPKDCIMTMDNFKEVVRYYKTDVGRRYDEFSNIRSQHSFICDSNKNIILDFVGRFENLQKDFNHICDKLKVKQIPLTLQNSSQASKVDWKIHYKNNPEAKDYIYQNWKRDIDAFNFKLEI